jgi:2-desacetyl-2-hydroxyethyl bacteriochlorophyllide A dehydrogenase
VRGFEGGIEMKAAVMMGAGKVEVRDVPEPRVAPNQVKVKIAFCGICGSELHAFDSEYQTGKPTFRGPVRQLSGPRIMGHEASGTIVEVGEDTKAGYKTGQRVAMDFRSYCGSCYYCRNKMQHFCERVTHGSGAYAEYAVYNEDAIYILPDNVSLEEGALLEPVAVAVHTLDIANIKPGSTMAILGGGPIGMLILELARKAGAAKILLSEPVEGRRNIAKQLGASVIVDPTNENLEEVTAKMTEGRGFDTVIDASGKLAVAKQAISLADNCGTIVWAAMYPGGSELPVVPSYMYARELTIKSVFVSPYCFSRALNLLPELDLKLLISIKPIENIVDCFQSLLKGQGMKILIKPS